jgi:hypothetical protein
MKTFYDKRGCRGVDDSPNIEALQGRVLWKTKTHWLIYISKDDYYNSFISNLEQRDVYHTTLIWVHCNSKRCNYTSMLSCY